MLGLQAALADLLSGRVTPENADPRILNLAEFHIHKGAVEILSMPFGQRKPALQKIPSTIRPYVEREVKRLWTLRKARDTK